MMWKMDDEGISSSSKQTIDRNEIHFVIIYRYVIITVFIDSRVNNHYGTLEHRGQ